MATLSPFSATWRNDVVREITSVQNDIDAIENDIAALPEYATGTFTPTVTLVGGAGNTVPVYTTNLARYTRIGNRVFADLVLSGDGGAEGAGTGVINIALPIAASASSARGQVIGGTALNGATRYILIATIAAGSSTMSLTYFSSISASAAFTGADQNNTTRNIQISVVYEV